MLAQKTKIVTIFNIIPAKQLHGSIDLLAY